MHKILALALMGACSAASAETPAVNLMPDGSRDMYVGLGAVSAPRWEGASERQVRALPLLQVHWSNGLFVSGLTAGMHLSEGGGMEYGPLLSIQAKRSDSGLGGGAGGVTNAGSSALAPLDKSPIAGANRLYGMDDVPARLQVGGFFNIYLAPQIRFANTLQYGAGHDHNGLVWNADLQHVASEIAAHHTLVASVGFSAVNQAWNQSYFGVSAAESVPSHHPVFSPKAGLKDVHLALRWNWALTPSWMQATGVKATRLTGDAANSPLTERSTNFSVSSGLAYRF